MKVGVVFGISELADPKMFENKSSKFLMAIAKDFEVMGGVFLSEKSEFKSMKEEIDFNEADVLVLYPLTGGTENALKEFTIYRKPIVLFGDSFNNSIAAAVELREYFRDNLIPATLVKDLDSLKAALLGYEDMKELFEKFLKMRLGLIGRTSIYVALKRIVEDYRLDGFTIGCFDLIGKIKGTPCLALAMFNAQGIPAACEGELNSLLGMVIARRFFNKPAFMGNIADYSENHIILAHCTAPLISSYVIRSHFESGMGVGVAVKLPKGKASLLKIRGRKAVVAGVEVIEQEKSEYRCRTQLRLKVEEAGDFIDGTLGNHHLLIYADSEELADLLSELGFEVMLY